MSVKINKLEIENVKRVRTLTLEPGQNGLTVIGGRNGQGKTSVLDAISWALGGDRRRPTQPQREGSVVPPSIRVKLSNGLLVERKGKNSALRVTDPSGARYGQQLLDDFVTQLALDLPKFLHATPKEKAQTLLKVIGVGDQLALLDKISIHSPRKGRDRPDFCGRVYTWTRLNWHCGRYEDGHIHGGNGTHTGDFWLTGAHGAMMACIFA